MSTPYFVLKVFTLKSFT